MTRPAGVCVCVGGRWIGETTAGSGQATRQKVKLTWASGEGPRKGKDTWAIPRLGPVEDTSAGGHQWA